MTDGIPEWAAQRAADLANAEPCADGGWSVKDIAQSYLFCALARYVMQHEQEPVDQDELLAREVVELHVGNDSSWTKHGTQTINAAVRSAIKLARERQAS